MQDWIGTGQSNSTLFLFEVRIRSQEKNWELKACFWYIGVYRAAVPRLKQAYYSNPIWYHRELL